MRLATPLFLLVTLLAGGAQAEIYKWVDANGNVHYSDSPPPGDSAQQVQLAPQPSEESLQQGREENARRLRYQQRESAARKETKETQQKEQQQSEKQAAKLQSQCKEARQQLKILNMQRPVYRKNEAGEREYVNAETRADEQAQLMAAIAEHCQ